MVEFLASDRLVSGPSRLLTPPEQVISGPFHLILEFRAIRFLPTHFLLCSEIGPGGREFDGQVQDPFRGAPVNPG